MNIEIIENENLRVLKNLSMDSDDIRNEYLNSLKGIITEDNFFKGEERIGNKPTQFRVCFKHLIFNLISNPESERKETLDLIKKIIERGAPEKINECLYEAIKAGGHNSDFYYQINKIGNNEPNESDLLKLTLDMTTHELSIIETLTKLANSPKNIRNWYLDACWEISEARGVKGIVVKLTPFEHNAEILLFELCRSTKKLRKKILNKIKKIMLFDDMINHPAEFLYEAIRIGGNISDFKKVLSDVRKLYLGIENETDSEGTIEGEKHIADMVDKGMEEFKKEFDTVEVLMPDNTTKKLKKEEILKLIQEHPNGQRLLKNHPYTAHTVLEGLKEMYERLLIGAIDWDVEDSLDSK